ncbi:MAG: DUF1993 domain-containing protein [Pseudomonadales bacterium]|nr:DUF1993 domain-containing protein [Pseudomonadales bacterium]
MSLSMYSSSVPVFTHYLKSLAVILKKGEDHASARKIDPAVLVSARLYPDMFPLSRQVQIACDVVKGCGGRLAGAEVPKFDDDESTLGQLQDRIAKTIAFLETLPEDKINGTEQTEIKIQAGPKELVFTGEYYLRNWALPNMFFHITTTYNILRHNGVEVGKMDFLG